MKPVAFVLALAASVAQMAKTVVAQQDNVQVFQGGASDVRREMLNRIATRRSELSVDEAQRVVAQGVVDADAHTREAALLAVASLAGGPRFSGDSATRNRWTLDGAAMQRLRPSVTSALHDANSRVRHAAILALGNLDYTLDPSLSNPPMSSGTIRELAAMYDRESDPFVRAELVKGFALSPNDSDDVRAVLRRAFEDSESISRQYAVSGAGRLKARELLWRVVDALEDSNVAVRLAAAASLGLYGSEAASYVPTLIDTREKESDIRVKGAITAAIKAINSARP